MTDHTRCYYLVAILIVYILVVTAMLIHADRRTKLKEETIKRMNLRMLAMRSEVGNINQLVRTWNTDNYNEE